MIRLTQGATECMHEMQRWLSKFETSAYCVWDEITGTQATMAYLPLKRKQPEKDLYVPQVFDAVPPVQRMELSVAPQFWCMNQHN